MALFTHGSVWHGCETYIQMFSAENGSEKRFESGVQQKWSAREEVISLFLQHDTKVNPQ